jgi:hypothetical protein
MIGFTYNSRIRATIPLTGWRKRFRIISLLVYCSELGIGFAKTTTKKLAIERTLEKTGPNTYKARIPLIIL